MALRVSTLLYRGNIMGDLNGIIDKWADDAVRDPGGSSWRELQ
ncbi:hypothetical protein ES703_37355 [subsurface metagenome]